MNVLITGGAGYIGSVVAERLIQFGHTPVIYDNLSAGHKESVPDGVAFVRSDLADTVGLSECLAANRIEAVIHMAASALVGESMENPSKYFRNNDSTGLGLLDAMLDAGVTRLVFSSTGAVFGEPESNPIPEDAPKNPTNPYGESKLIFEKMLRWYDTAHGMKYAALRYFNAAGATERCGEHHAPETHLIPLVLDVAQGKRPDALIFGDDYPTQDGTCIRDYIHVSDLADAHILALDALDRGSRAYNLGNGSGRSVREVVESARRVTGKPIPERMTARRPGDPAVMVASSVRIKQELGWNPQLADLDAIIESAWKWRLAHPNGYE